jgi:hypothetical protein
MTTTRKLWVQVANRNGGYDVYRNVHKLDAINAPEGLVYLILAENHATVSLLDILCVEPMD